ncbi:protein-(glutamine-N5) methyltransferase, release factor-specific [Chryseobacterium sp. Leaf180]|uniref:peptide chain release factor N(5)-glutamine methyltransferase n=1 Tax=Chryseobacterium sp. Leaf180 TaxID=1736289 RepID=UPI0007010A17|nr:peptide chain release factor N(5)-glutamine methyltransferase [Chryseobacterium sp. Leaf180]KQR94486.1 protein-(glutamine-N5) methyltransferase, release factor-specific [Chryseobacterium sp. Leaf180]
MVFSEVKKSFTERLSGNYSQEEINILFEIFAENILEINRIQQRSFSDQEISTENLKKFIEVIIQLESGKPYQQILGETEFYGMKFFVNEHVLIPRPETEELLEIAIEKISKSHAQNTTLKILDIGTGSGIIPLVLKKHFPKADIISIDFSEKALMVAQRNADFHQLKINCIHADYLKIDFKENFDIIISNPPYIGINEEIEIADSVKEFEPKMALFSPTSDALIFYRKIAEDCEKYLIKNGLLFLEINQKLGKETLDLFKNFSESELRKDLSGNDRFIIGIK